MPGVLGPENLDTIPHDKLLASQGSATVLATGEKVQIKTIVPAQHADGSCVFLRQGLCELHEIGKPSGCALSRVCEETREETLAQAALYERVMQSSTYQQTWNELRNRGQVARPVADRLAAFSKKIFEVRRTAYKRKRRSKG